jgi:hypothetical protein
MRLLLPLLALAATASAATQTADPLQRAAAPFPSRRHFGLTLIVALAASALSGAESPRVDSSTLTGKVMVGYQGWFNAEGDGAKRGYNHWTRGGGEEQRGDDGRHDGDEAAMVHGDFSGGRVG